jgi:hypothetical protein
LQILQASNKPTTISYHINGNFITWPNWSKYLKLWCKELTQRKRTPSPQVCQKFNDNHQILQMIMMHRILWWIIIIINFFHQFDVFCKTFCTKIKIKRSKGFKTQDKGCSKSKRDQPLLSCTTTHAIHSLDFLRKGGGGPKKKTISFVIFGKRCEIHYCAKNPSCSCLLFIFIHCLPSPTMCVFLSQKIDLFIALPSQFENHAVVIQFLFLKILCLYFTFYAHKAPRSKPQKWNLELQIWLRIKILLSQQNFHNQDLRIFFQMTTTISTKSHKQ